jgi:hypothetical protein
LLAPVVFVYNDEFPNATFSEPVVFDLIDCKPMAVLLAPEVFKSNDWLPKAEFPKAVLFSIEFAPIAVFDELLFLIKALVPTATFPAPVVFKFKA